MTLILGKNREPSKNFNENANVVQSKVVREDGTALFGAQGSGKSSLIESMVYQDACNGEAIFVIDPHYDLINNIIAQLPAHRLKDTYLLDLTDTNYPFSCNFLDGSRMRDIDQATDWAETVFKKIFPAEGEQLLLNKVLRMLALTMLSSPGSTIADIPRLLKDNTYRAGFVERVKNRHVRDYWNLEYDKMSPAKQNTEMYALNNRLPVLLTKPRIEYILAQPQSTLDFRKSIDAKEIILIRLPVDEYKEVAPIIGTVLLAELYRSAFSYTDTPREKRSGFSVYIDEWHEFVADDIGKMFTSLRKFGCKLVVATQYRNKLKGLNYDSVMTASTIVALRLSPDDARSFAPLYLDRNKKPKLAKLYWDVLKRLSKHDSQRVYHFAETVVKSLHTIATDDDDSRFMKAKIALECLEKLLLASQKQEAIDEDLFNEFITSMGWYYGYADIGTIATKTLDLHDISLKEFTVLTFLEAFEALDKLKKYYYIMHYRYFYPSFDDPTVYVTCKDVMANTKFWDMVDDENNTIWLSNNEQNTQIFEFLQKQATYHKSIPENPNADIENLRKEVRNEYDKVFRELLLLLSALYRYKATHLVATERLSEYYRWQAARYANDNDSELDEDIPPLYDAIYEQHKKFWGQVYYDTKPWIIEFGNGKTELCYNPQAIERDTADSEDRQRLLFGLPEDAQQYVRMLNAHTSLRRKLNDIKIELNNPKYIPEKLTYTESVERSALRKEKKLYISFEQLRDARDKEITEHLEKLRDTHEKTDKQFESYHAQFQDRDAKKTNFSNTARAIVNDIIAQPIGEYEKQETASDIATTLEQFPKRYALVKMGQEDASQSIFSLYTVDRPAVVGKDALAVRIENIQARTRNKYCRTRTEIDAELNAAQSTAKSATQKSKNQTPLPSPETDNETTSTHPYALYGEVEE